MQFSEPVTCAATDFSVTGDQTGSQAFTLAYSSTSYTATLTFAQPLAKGQTWTVQVADSVHSVAAGAALDGELANPSSLTSLPSGDGLPGGSAVFTFFVAGVGDFDLDGDVDQNDFEIFRACISGANVPGPPAGCTQAQFNAADLDHDGDVDQDDFAILQRAYRESGTP